MVEVSQTILPPNTSLKVLSTTFLWDTVYFFYHKINFALPMAPDCGAIIPRQGAIGKFSKKGCVTIKSLNLNRCERWKEKILERLRSQLVKKSQGARSIQKVKQKRFFIKRNEGISSIVYLLYLKQIYLHIFMQHSFITIYMGLYILWEGVSMFFDH